MRIRLNSILVDDQSKALKFYTGVLGFIKSQEIPVGEFRWLTVRSPEGGDAELSLEPNANPQQKPTKRHCSGREFRLQRSKSTTSVPSMDD